METSPHPTLLIVAQKGRLTYEAVLFLASLRRFSPDFKGRIVVAEPQPGGAWVDDPRIVNQDARDVIERLGAEIRPFTAELFGTSYPQGNKVEALSVLNPREQFVFFDSDTVVFGPLDQVHFPKGRPTASMAREATWPQVPLYGPGYAEIWSAIYDRFGVSMNETLDMRFAADHWERYLYFNAGWFTANDAHAFRDRMLEIMLSLRDNTPPELAAQSLFPWLDQIALPVTIASFGGGRPGPELAGLDGETTLHWRVMPLLYATAPDEVIEKIQEITAPNRIKKVLKGHEPFLRMIYQNRGAKVRALFDQDNLPLREQAIRQRIKRAGHWMR